MKNIKKYIELLAGTFAVTVIAYGSEGQRPESVFRFVQKDNYNVIQTGPKNTNPFCVKEISENQKPKSTFKSVPKAKKRTGIKNTNPFSIKGRGELLKRKRNSFSNAGFIISEKYENLYLTIREYLEKNNLELSPEDLKELERWYLFPMIFLKKATNILKQPIIYLGKVNFLFSDNTEITIGRINQAEDIIPLVDEYDNIIIVIQEVSNAFYIVTPPNKQ